MNNSIIEGRWEQFKGQVKQTWGELTDDDLKRAEGSLDKLTGIVRERYGLKKEEATKQIADFVDKIEKTFTSGSSKSEKAGASSELPPPPPVVPPAIQTGR